MNEIIDIRLWGHLISGEGWGRAMGTVLHDKLSRQITAHASATLVRIAMDGVRLDASCASASIIALVSEHLGSRSICLTQLDDPDLFENVAAAAERARVPVAVWNRAGIHMVGPLPNTGNQQALAFTLAQREVRAAEFSQIARISITNASTRFKQLWESGYLMRSAGTAASGGSEFIYRPIG